LVAGIVALAATGAYSDFGLLALLVLGLPPALVLFRSARPHKAATA
jgi:hypothetical protein